MAKKTSDIQNTKVVGSNGMDQLRNVASKPQFKSDSWVLNSRNVKDVTDEKKR